MRLAVVVQRYGVEIAGGAELHARLVAELLARSHEVTVLTTCALDYVTWRNELDAGVDDVNGLPVLRFPVRRARDPLRYGRLQEQVFHRDHDERTARRWMDAQGPYSPRMRRWIRRNRERFDYFICFSYRYWTTYETMRAVNGKGVLVPTAEPDPAIGVPLFRPIFRSARAIMYNSPEERAMIVRHADNAEVPGVVVGVGIIDPPPVSPERFRERHELHRPFLLYVGRIDVNKGCAQLFDYYRRTRARLVEQGRPCPDLVLAGSAVMDVPDDPGVTWLGRVSEQDKYDAIAACDALVMPSFYESLSMVLLEAWALGRPVLVNGHCDVLQGQVRRSNGGLYYRNGAEFLESAALIGDDERLREALGRCGNAYYEANYRWPVIAAKYESILDRLAQEDGRLAPEDAG